MAFEIKKYKNQFYLKNTGTVSSTYSLGLLSNCCTCEVNVPANTQYSISPGQEIILPLSIDNQYVVKLPATGEPVNTFNINYFVNLEARIVKDVKAFLCGDNCLDCNNEIGIKKLENLVQYQNIFNEIQAYFYLNGFNIDETDCINLVGLRFVQSAINLYRCDIQKELCIQVNSYDYFGRYTGSLELFNKFIAIYYLNFYFSQYESSTDDIGKQYIDDLYQICDIKRCIQKVGIDLEDLRELYRDIRLNCTEQE